MSDILEYSSGIWKSVIAKHKPSMTVCLVSGGNDSKAAAYVARGLGIDIDALVFVNTRTGIAENAQHIEAWAKEYGKPLLIADAGSAYEDYVLRKGFIGRGQQAHSYAYHILKAQPLRKLISSQRQGRRNFKVLMITGIRLDESDNRKYNFANRTVSADKASPNNIFVNLIEHFTKRDVMEIIRAHNAPRNPVADILHRSGECFCGTTQSDEDRQLAKVFYPEHGAMLDDLERRVCERHPWKWGQEKPAWLTQMEKGQMAFGDEYLPMCMQCQLRGES